MNTLEAIHSRRSVHAFQKIPVEKQKWGKLLEAGNLAPCAGNIQNWKFIVVQNKQTIEQIALACYQQEWITTAPAVILVVGDTQYLAKYYPDHADQFSIQNCAAATQNILLAAQELGLSTCWVGAYDQTNLRQATGVPDDKKIMSVIALGYADEKVPMPPKQVFKKYAYVERYGSGIENINLVLGNYGQETKDSISKSRGFFQDLIFKAKQSMKSKEKKK